MRPETPCNRRKKIADALHSMDATKLAAMLRMSKEDTKEAQEISKRIIKARGKTPFSNIFSVFENAGFSKSRIDHVLAQFDYTPDIIENADDLKDNMPEIMEKINKSQVLCKQWLTDPGTLLEDLGYYPSCEVKKELRKAVVKDYSDVHRRMYHKLKTKKKGLDMLSDLRLTFEPEDDQPGTSTKKAGSTNPLGSFDLGFQITVPTLNRLLMILFEEQVIPGDVTFFVSGQPVRILIRKSESGMELSGQELLFSLQMSISGGPFDLNDPDSYDSFEFRLRFSIQTSQLPNGTQALSLMLSGIDSIYSNDLGKEYTRDTQQDLRNDLSNPASGSIQALLWILFFDNVPNNQVWQTIEDLIRTQLNFAEGINISSFVSALAPGFTLSNVQPLLIAPATDGSFEAAASLSADTNIAASNTTFPGLSFTSAAIGDITAVTGFVRPGQHIGIGMGQPVFERLLTFLWAGRMGGTRIGNLRVGRLMDATLVGPGATGTFTGTPHIRIKFRANIRMVSEFFDCDSCVPDVDANITLRLAVSINPSTKSVTLTPLGDPSVDPDDDDLAWLIVSSVLWGVSGIGLPIFVEKLIELVELLTKESSALSPIENVVGLKFRLPIPGTDIDALVTGETVTIRAGEFLLNGRVELPTVFNMQPVVKLLDLYNLKGINSNGDPVSYGWPFQFDFSPYINPFPYNPFWTTVETFSTLTINANRQLVRTYKRRERLKRRLLFNGKAEGFSGPVEMTWTFGTTVQSGATFALNQQPLAGEVAQGQFLVLEALDAFFQIKQVQLFVPAFTGQERVVVERTEIVPLKDNGIDFNPQVNIGWPGADDDDDTIPANMGEPGGDPEMPEIPPGPNPKIPNEFSSFDMMKGLQNLEFARFRNPNHK